MAGVLTLVVLAALAPQEPAPPPPTLVNPMPRVHVVRDDEHAVVEVRIEGRLVTAYRWDDPIPHLWPVRSPSARDLTEQHPDPYPHHRSLWLADRMRIEGGPDVDFYHCQKNLVDEADPAQGYRHFIRHERITAAESGENEASLTCELRWIVDRERPVLDEERRVRVAALEDGDVLIDLSWTWTAAHGAVEFTSDWVHYAWPYARVHPRFSGKEGGTIRDDRGREGQKETNGHYADWVDYSNTVDGETEGIALMPFPDPDGAKRKWLTRDYGTFGPRRPDARSGTKFTLAKGETLSGRCGILLHGGDTESGRVAERYEAYAKGEL